MSELTAFRAVLDDTISPTAHAWVVDEEFRSLLRAERLCPNSDKEGQKMNELDFSSFDQAVNDAEIDPRPRVKALVRRVVDADLRSLPMEIAQDLLRSRLPALAQRIATAIERGNFSALEHLVDAFDVELISAVRHEREHGRLRPKTAGIEERLNILEAHAWGSAEVENVRVMIAGADPLRVVDWSYVETESGRRITRDEVRAFGRPEGWSNDSTWQRRFVSDAEVERAREVAARREREAAAPYAGNCNFDLPGGIRPGR